MTAGCEFGCCTPEVAALPDGGWMNTDKGWVIDPRRRLHVENTLAREMVRIDRMQADFPKCRACGQRARVLDRWGLCSKVDGRHRQIRPLPEPQRKAGAR